MTVRPSSRHVPISFRTVSSVGWSTPVNGSSSRSSSASCAATWASSARWRWPPDSSPSRRPGQVVDGKRTHRVGDQLAVAIGHSPPPAERAPAAHRDHVAHGGREHRLDRDLLGQVGDAVGRRRHLACRRLGQPDGRREQRALPRAVRAEHGDGCSARHLDVDRLEGDDVAVADGHVLRRQDHGASAPAIRSAS